MAGRLVLDPMEFNTLRPIQRQLPGGLRVPLRLQGLGFKAYGLRLGV